MRLFHALLALALLAGCQRQQAGVTTLTYASPYPATHPFSQADVTWMHWVEVASHGHLRIQPYWGGVLLSSNENMLEIRHGVADIGMVTPMYARSAHLQRVQSGFYSGVRSVADQVAAYKCLAARFPALNGELRDLHILAVQGGNLPGILTRNRPIRTLADLKGLRLRAQEDTADVLHALGADTVNMSMAEVYPAMAKGVIDGVVAPVDALKAVHLADVGRYYSTISVPRGAYPGRAIGDAKWRSLSPADQAVLTRGEAVWEGAMAAQLDKARVAGERYAQTEKLQVIPLPAADQARFNALYRANSMRLAGGLSRYGIDGTSIAQAATAIVASGPATCINGERP